MPVDVAEPFTYITNTLIARQERFGVAARVCYRLSFSIAAMVCGWRCSVSSSACESPSLSNKMPARRALRSSVWTQPVRRKAKPVSTGRCRLDTSAACGSRWRLTLSLALVTAFNPPDCCSILWTRSSTIRNGCLTRIPFLPLVIALELLSDFRRVFTDPAVS